MRTSQPIPGTILLALALLCLTMSCARASSRTIDIATTASVQNSGLLNHLLPSFEQASGITVRVHAAGRGRAPQMLADDLVQAFQRIADANVRFVSRGDESGTHERERMLWSVAGRRPLDRRIIVSGGGMAQALRHANEVRGYVLSDAPTLWQMASDVDLKILFENDPRLVNAYAVNHRKASPEAAAFATWLTSADGIAAIGSFKIAGKRAYEPWPAGCASGRPPDLACS